MTTKEIEARILALTMVRNAGGTYKAAGEKYGFHPSQISAYARGATIPRERNLDDMRAATS